MNRFRPHPLLRSPHVQTLLSSNVIRRRTAASEDAERVVLTDPDGVTLEAVVNVCPGAPLVVLIHGWLGSAYSPYLVRAANALTRAGFSTARLVLRDHGGTEHLNEEMFHSARIDEVLHGVNALTDRFGRAGTGLLGYSLGGNFALRLACDERRHGRVAACLAVCPAVDPEATVHAIDNGWWGYRLYFLRRWKRALADKAAAFPERYDFSDTERLGSVADLTAYTVARHTPFADVHDYYARYTVDGQVLSGLHVPARILAAADDPLIPAATVAALPERRMLETVVTPYGGHCAFIEDFSLGSLVAEYATRYFTEQLARN